MEEARKKLTASRIWVRRLSNSLKSYLDNTDSSVVDECILENSIGDLNNKINSLNNAQEQVELLTPVTELESLIEQADDFMSSVKPLVIASEKLLFKIKSRSNETCLDNKNDTSSSTCHGGHSVNLPKLELSPFYGDILQWQSFWDQFEAVIDSSDLPLVSKLTYLRSVLRGEALSSLKGLAITADSYETAKIILKQRYGRPERIIFSHLQKLLDMKEVSSLDSGTLWKLHDDLTSHIRSLDNLGVSGDNYGVVLTPLILSRLPVELRMEWAREGEGKEGDLEFLMTFLFKEIQRRERSHTFSKGNQSAYRQHTSEPNDRRSPRPKIASTTSLYNSSSEPSSSKCCFCSGVHPSEKCRVFIRLPFKDRKRKILETRVCFSCFGFNHMAKDCRRRCRNCRGRHHELVCKTSDKRLSGTTEQFEPIEQDIEQTELKVPMKQSVASHVGVASGNSQIRTVMQTIPVSIKGVSANVLFDSGSDRSYISSSLVSKITPEFISSESIAVACFGNKQPSKSKEHNLYKIHLAEQPMIVTEINNICAPLCRPNVPIEHLKAFDHISFPIDYSNNDENVTIDILIGLDYYWLFLCDEKIKSEGLVAQKTTLGWMLSGSVTGSAQKCVSFQFLCFNNTSCETCVSKMWDLESLGIDSNEQNVSDDKILTNFNKTVRLNDNRYEVNLPWKLDVKQSLQNNSLQIRTKKINES